MADARAVLSRLEAIGAAAQEQAPEDPSRFADYAADALRAVPPLTVTETAALLDNYVRGGAEALPVSRSVFGDMELLVYDSDALSIQLLFWLDATTTIHDHGFSGAFKLLAGRSLHGTYRFEAREELSASLEVGALMRISTDALGPGTCVKIPPGPALIHSLFHLDRPSLTCVLRTKGTGTGERQRDYLFPHLASMPSAEDPRLARRVEALRCLAAIDEDALATAHAAFLEETGPGGLFMSLAGGVWQQLSAGARQAAAAGFGRGSAFREVLVSYVFDQATRDAARLRWTVRDEEARGLLGCLATSTSAASCADAAMQIGIGPEQAGAGLARLAGSLGRENLGTLDVTDLAPVITGALLGDDGSATRDATLIAALKRHPLFARLMS